MRARPRIGTSSGVARDNVGDWLRSAATHLTEEDWNPDPLLYDLDALRRSTPEAVWRSETVPRIRSHALYRTALECPFSRRSTDKPRGYSGDALLLDFLYQRPAVAALMEQTTDLGRRLCDYWVASPAARAVRARRDFLKAKLETMEGARVLAVACGHLTEATESSMARAGAFSRYVAFDQDPQSLDHIRRYGSFPGLELVCERVKALFRPAEPGESYDLIYAAGLYDYLDQGAAQRLTMHLFERLAPGGELVVGNFLPDTPNIASMDVFQDWRLRYRTHDEIEDLVARIPPALVAQQRYTTDPDVCIGILELRRGGA